MSISMKEGEELELVTSVKDTDTARVYGSGLLDVYSTPAMMALMEKASMQLVQAHLEPGHGTVGISLDIKHMKAVPTGEEIRCTSRLTSIEGRRLTFEVKVYHGKDLVGGGSHSRYIINEQRFLSGIKK